MSLFGPNVGKMIQEQKRKQQEAAQAAEIKRAAALDAQGKNPDGSAKDVKYTSKLKPDGTLMDQYRSIAQPDIQVDMRAQNAIRDRSQGSAWLDMMKGKQGLEEQNALQSASQGANTAAAQQANSLAQRGGLSSGSRERMAKSAARDALMAQQNARRQGMVDRTNLDIQNDQTQLGLTKDLVGYDQQNAQLAGQNRDYSTNVNDKNISRTFDEQAQQRQFDMEQYKSKMQAWGAEKTADAQRAAAGAARGGKK
jgi:hypothetical protein